MMLGAPPSRRARNGSCRAIEFCPRPPARGFHKAERPRSLLGGMSDLSGVEPHKPLRSRPNLLWQGWDGRLEHSRRNLLRLEGLAVCLLSGDLPYPQGPEK